MDKDTVVCGDTPKDLKAQTGWLEWFKRQRDHGIGDDRKCWKMGSERSQAEGKNMTKRKEQRKKENGVRKRGLSRCVLFAAEADAAFPLT